MISVELPPLRKRAEDIPLLIEHSLKRLKAGESINFTDAALDCLLTYYWPGNIRELQNTVERMVVLNRGEPIDLHHLPAKLRSTSYKSRHHVVELPPEGYSLEAIEREVVVQALERNGWNKTQAANFLQVPRHTLLYRIEKYDINKP